MSVSDINDDEKDSDMDEKVNDGYYKERNPISEYYRENEF
jgi:hypothetical protein